MKPILFSTHMVQVILAGRKTMTRRVIKQSVVDNFLIGVMGILVGSYREGMAEAYPTVDDAPYSAGDVLWVRETWMPETEQRIHTGGYIYRASDRPEPDGDAPLKWHPSIFMPKEAARIFLRVIDVRAERLREISEEDARAEGCITFHDKIGDGKFDDVLEFDLTAKDAFCELWERLNKKRGYGWDTNPWVWVYTFERITPDEAMA